MGYVYSDKQESPDFLFFSFLKQIFYKLGHLINSKYINCNWTADQNVCAKFAINKLINKFE